MLERATRRFRSRSRKTDAPRNCPMKSIGRDKIILAPKMPGIPSKRVNPWEKMAPASRRKRSRNYSLARKISLPLSSSTTRTTTRTRRPNDGARSFNRDIGSFFPVRSTERALSRFSELFRGFSGSVSGVIYSRTARKKGDLSSRSGRSLRPQIGLRLAAFRGDPLRFPWGEHDEFSFSTASRR